MDLFFCFIERDTEPVESNPTKIKKKCEHHFMFRREWSSMTTIVTSLERMLSADSKVNGVLFPFVWPASIFAERQKGIGETEHVPQGQRGAREEVARSQYGGL